MAEVVMKESVQQMKVSRKKKSKSRSNDKNEEGTLKTHLSKSFSSNSMASNKQSVVQKHREGILEQEIEFIQQSDIHQGNGRMAKKRNAKIKHNSEAPASTDETFQRKKKKRKRPFPEDHGAKESCDETVAQSDNFKLDCGSSEHVKKKRKFKKRFEQSFTDIMQETPSAKTSGASVKTLTSPSATSNKILGRSESSENDSPDFVKLHQKKLHGFEGREDTPERLSRTVFVGNLPLSFNKKLLHRLFQNLGEIESVRLRSVVPAKLTIPKRVAVIRKQFHNNSNSINGYVVFKNVADVEKALTLNKTVVQSHHIRVDKFRANTAYDGKRSVFVGNLPYDTTTESLWSAFGECGSIEAVRVVRDPETGVGKGFAFVLFEECDSVQRALLLNDTEVNGRKIRVKLVEKGSKLKLKTPVESQGTNPKTKKKYPPNSWRPRGQKKKTNKKLMKRRIDIKKKKKISSILIP